MFDCVRIFSSFSLVCVVRLLFFINSVLICVLNVFVFGRFVKRMMVVIVRIRIIVIIFVMIIVLFV